ncbi:MAG: gerPE [Paenibacillaceae bacterium]|nr:gerPE [Paenibacillaceae bacterium]
MTRTSIVGAVRIISSQISSIVQFGDSVGLAAVSQVLAVQQETANFQGNEGDNWREYPFYSRELPVISPGGEVLMNRRNPCPNIRVGAVSIYGLSAAAVLQIGSNRLIDLENRTFHIRQYDTKEEADEQEPYQEQAEAGGGTAVQAGQDAASQS